MNVTLLSCTPAPEEIVAKAAYVCTTNYKINEIKVNDKGKMIEKVIRQRHLSVLEHVNFTFGIEDISRVCLAQLTRHRLASFSVRSQRYVNSEFDEWVYPEDFKLDDNAWQIFASASDDLRDSYHLLVDHYGHNIEDARYLLPQATTTSLMMTMNARELLHFFALRCCMKAQWEIRELAYRMLDLVKPVAPNIFKNAGAQCDQDGFCRQDNSCKRTIHINKLKKYAVFGGADIKEESQ